jgi:broad specificity phosphatase PhoE
MRQRLALSLATLLALAAVPGSASDPAEPPTGPELAFLVRHAEKDPGDDPGLSAAGSARALRLAELLAGQSIERVYVTATRRARDTAAPLAARFGLPVEIYDPKKLAELATTLRERKETVLVVGHSNTTDELAVLLGGESAGPMPDEEYDRLYRVDLADGSTVVRRY